VAIRSFLVAALVAALCSLTAAGTAAAAQPGFVEAVGQTVSGPAVAGDTHAKWARVWLSWSSAEPSRGSYVPAQFQVLRDRVAAYHAVGTKVDIVLYTTPAWARLGLTGNPFTQPANPADYAAFARYAAGAIPAADAWEIWNEEDDSNFWEHGPQVGAYTRLLRAAYPAIKAVRPSATVVTGGMVGQDVAFLNGIYANGGRGYFDAVGVHTDFACLVEDPGAYYRDPNGWLGRYTFTGYRELHYVMASHGDGHKGIWMTELGWNTSTSAPGSCSRGLHAHMKAAGVTEAQQATFLTRAYQCLAADPYLQVAIWFSLQDVDNSSEDDHRLGLIRHDGSHKPAYAAFSALQHGVKAAQCGGVADHTPPKLSVGAPTDGKQYLKRLPISVSASDATPLTHIEAIVDGVRRGLWHKSSVEQTAWWPAANLSYGRHTITFRAMDAGGNVASRTVSVFRVRHLAATLVSHTTLRVSRRAARRVRVTAALLYPAGQAPPEGRIYVVFERRIGSRWRAKLHRWVPAKPHGFTVTLGPGRWRVHAIFPKSAPYKASRSAYRTLTVR
jgi:hypothetical protein